MNIVLIGYRGSGKTTLGKLIADDTWKDFIDTDEAIRKAFGNATIADIWAEHGEAAFRAKEVEVVRDAMQKSDHVIALGGGSLMQAGAREAVENADALRVYLYCEPEVLLQRIEGDKDTADSRPNLTEQGGGLDEIKAVLAEREPVYRAVADKEFDVTHLDESNVLRYFIKYCMTAE